MREIIRIHEGGISLIAYLSGIMEKILNLFFIYTNNYGVAIIGLTILIKLVLMPLSYKQFKSMGQMQKIAPEQKRLQEKYKNDKEKLNEELMKLYLEHKINPAAGCLPMIVQMPFLFAFFRLLRDFNFAQASFLWITDLSAPDTYFILPALAGLTTYLSSKMTATSPDGSQNNMSLFMSIFIIWISTRFAAGLALYWVVSNLFQLAQQMILTRSVGMAKEESGT